MARTSIGTDWLRLDQNEEARNKTRQLIANSSNLLERLKAILQVKRVEIAQPDKWTDYDSPNWPYKMADRNGALRELDYVIKLLTIETKSEK